MWKIIKEIFDEIKNQNGEYLPKIFKDLLNYSEIEPVEKNDGFWYFGPYTFSELQFEIKKIEENYYKWLAEDQKYNQIDTERKFGLKLIDKLLIVIAPALIGGKETSTLIDGESLQTFDDLIKIKALKLIENRTLNDSYINLKYEIINETKVE